eukprot:TRINITY_DN51916_c0_g2_i1.p1 TRINITY_DN51916_c0_g2~~TRINITY_DN51916_c0_g2_i1.p1  ORF type:complete len:696 (-),score=186.50 TRINITY_DN51916_c0_g2_i1:103-2190(-)
MGATASTDGPKVDERYHVQKVKLGSGSFGTVWKAVDRQNGVTVAMKQLSREKLPQQGQSLRDIEREVAMMKACHHENLLALIDVFVDAKFIFLALEYCEGGDFGDKIKELGKGLMDHEVAEWMRQVCSGIAMLHSKGICHRDIKPDNFMVLHGGAREGLLKLSDFGLAVFAPPSKLLKEKCGTPAFMAPELHALPGGSQGYWLPVDVWAAGVLMYMLMMGGKIPFIDWRGNLNLGDLSRGALDFSSAEDQTGISSMLTSAIAGLGGQASGTPPKQHAAAGHGPSPEAQDVCRRMVQPDPRARLHAADILQMPWFQHSAQLRRGRANSTGSIGSQPSHRSSSKGTTSRHQSFSHSSAAAFSPPMQAAAPPMAAHPAEQLLQHTQSQLRETAHQHEIMRRKSLENESARVAAQAGHMEVQKQNDILRYELQQKEQQRAEETNKLHQDRHEELTKLREQLAAEHQQQLGMSQDVHANELARRDAIIAEQKEESAAARREIELLRAGASPPAPSSGISEVLKGDRAPSIDSIVLAVNKDGQYDPEMAEDLEMRKLQNRVAELAVELANAKEHGRRMQEAAEKAEAELKKLKPTTPPGSELKEANELIDVGDPSDTEKLLHKQSEDKGAVEAALLEGKKAQEETVRRQDAELGDLRSELSKKDVEIEKLKLQLERAQAERLPDVCIQSNVIPPKNCCGLQ